MGPLEQPQAKGSVVGILASTILPLYKILNLETGYFSGFPLGVREAPYSTAFSVLPIGKKCTKGLRSVSESIETYGQGIGEMDLTQEPVPLKVLFLFQKHLYSSSHVPGTILNALQSINSLNSHSNPLK